MKPVRIGAAELNQTPLDWRGNQRRIETILGEAAHRGVGLLCLPELCITGYGCEDAFHARFTQQTAWEVLEDLVPLTEGMAATFGLPLFHRGAVFNATCVAVDGRIAGLVAKQYLAGDGIHYEPRWFKPWMPGMVHGYGAGGEEVPLGDLYFNLGGVLIGLEICEDAWVAQRPGAGLALKGVDLILNPSASHFAFGKAAVRERFVVEGSRAFGVGYVYANLVGNEAGRIIYDGGSMIASGGVLVASGPRFSFGDCSLTTAVVDIDLNRMNRARSGSFRPNLDPNRTDMVTVPFTLPATDALPDTASHPPTAFRKEEEFTRAVSLGLFDYLRKSRSEGFVVSLSGGADSTAVCLLATVMVHLALRELGPDGVEAKLGYLPAIPEKPTPEAWSRRLLTCVYQRTANSSDATRNAARTVAEALPAQWLDCDVDPLVRGYRAMIEGALGRDLSWESDDLALQNIQARARAPGVWMVANVRNALLLATSNRSEAAVGYTTMDGDTCGGLSPIAGIDKAFLRQWLRWMETTGPDGVGPWPAVAAVNALEPTAELRPSDRHQTDESDLMPYPLLDAIERAAIRDKQSPLQVFHQMSNRFPDTPRDQMRTWVERFFLLWCRNQWKRERYAPSFHLDDENLDPKTWCRFPILSGSFERELEALRD